MRQTSFIQAFDELAFYIGLVSQRMVFFKMGWKN